ncbi:hypothetical protein HNR65_002939 [Desulfosalsimonas propionicica]|jgi:hypothetical protein|uniref:Cardiolipin synthase N-terminal domain-containing protein n=1 Tax=Desulfosalsimonas propionicica TaxID=332175 RepID=A0A7W0HLR1_9BACT|nr:PLDc N-terminal domain-containing protein [Desulfosalsimonas propionicica]MBA2882587.1 hypothetical protein [Desulfosalsimonas propionicica]
MNLASIGTFLIISIPFFLLTVWALVDVSLKTFPGKGEKVLWWIIAITPFAGWLIYLVLGFRRGVKQNPTA